MTQVLATPIKSLNDKNNYRLIQLSNDLKVLLIQRKEDVESVKKIAAMSLSVDVGGYDDPADAKGLSHFMEHAVFMGTQKYPGENEFDVFVAMNGGYTNAYTTFNKTKFHCSVFESSLDEALDRFSSLFIAPLISETSIERELEALESEFQNKKNDERTKISRIMKLTLKSSSDPLNTFSIGSKNTLKNNRTNADLCELLHDHHRKFYVANRMNLAVESSLDLDDLQILIEKYFNDMKSGLNRIETTDNIEEVFDTEMFNKLIYIKPQTNERKLIISIPMPFDGKYYKCKPLSFLRNILNDSFEGSLSSCLKKNLLITKLIVYYAGDSGDMAPVLQIRLNLTDYGCDHIDDVLKTVSSYLRLIKETPMEKYRVIFDELMKIGQNDFDYEETYKGPEYANICTSNMALYDDIDVLRGKKLFFEFDEELIGKYIDLLTVESFNLLMMDYNYDGNYTEVEEMCGSEYRVEDIPENFKKVWSEREINFDLKLPPKNEFICTNFDIYSIKEGVVKMKHPEKIFENTVAETWFKLDSTFKLPSAHVNIVFISPLSFQSKFNIALLDVYVQLMNRFLSEKLALAEKSQFDCTIKINSKNHLELNFYGFNEKLPLLIDIVTKELLQFDTYIGENSHAYSVLKDDFVNKSKKRLISGDFITSMLNYITLAHDHHEYENFCDLQKITIENLKIFVEKYFKRLKIKILIQGNFSRDEALSISEVILGNINAESVDDLSLIEEKTLKIPQGRHVLKLNTFLPNENNSKMYDFYDFGERSLRKDCLIKMLTKITSEPIFNILRTKEQLAYTVNLNVKKMLNSIGATFFIKYQEDKHSTSSIALRLQQFIRVDVREILENLSDENFAHHKEFLINSDFKPFDNLITEFYFNWNQITSEYYSFEYNKKMTEMLGKISKQDVIDFYNEYFNEPRNLSVQYIGNVDKASADSMEYKYITDKDDDAEEVIANIENFKNNLETYESFKLTYTYD